MADQWDSTVFGDFEAEEDEVEASHEQLIFLIDAGDPMLELADVRKKRAKRKASEGDAGRDGSGDPAGHSGMQLDGKQGGLGGAEEEGEEDEPDEEFEGLSWLGAAVHVAQAVMRHKVVAAKGDQVAVVLYSTRESTAEGDKGGVAQFPGTWVLHPLEAPSAESIARLEDFSVESFRRDIGSAPAGAGKASSLKSALWLALSMVQARGKQVTGASHRLLLFTRDQEPFRRFDRGHDPSHEWRMIAGHLRSLRDLSAALELYPMTGPADPPFDLAPFWRGMLGELRGGREEGGETMDEGEQVGHIGDFNRLVRSKAHRKRALGMLLWALGPREGDLRIAVRIYQLLAEQKIPPPRRVNAQNGAEVRAVTSELNLWTGGAVDKRSSRYYYPNVKGVATCHLPKTYVTLDELKAMKGHGQAGMALLGFKPLSCLKEYHQLRSSSFIYPDDKVQPGSATAFIALHAAMLRSRTMAICRLAVTRARSPSLVALVPAEEAEFDDGSQAEPPGMHAIYLPYCDDLRSPETNTDWTGTERAQPSEEAVAAGEQLVAALTMPAFLPGEVQNPALQRHYEVLEAMAMNEEPPPLEEAQAADGTQPAFDEDQEAGLEEGVGLTLGDVIRAFKDVVGLASDEEAKKAAPKRKTSEPVDAGAVDALGIEDKAAQGAGALKGLKNDDLKAWLKAHGCTVSGKKEELIARIMNKLGL